MPSEEHKNISYEKYLEKKEDSYKPLAGLGDLLKGKLDKKSEE